MKNSENTTSSRTLMPWALKAVMLVLGLNMVTAATYFEYCTETSSNDCVGNNDNQNCTTVVNSQGGCLPVGKVCHDAPGGTNTVSGTTQTGVCQGKSCITSGPINHVQVKPNCS
jgi:hypothetical protein